MEEKIEKAEADVIVAKKKYDQATANLKELLDKRDAIRKEEILSAVVKSGRSYEEIMNFLRDTLSATCRLPVYEITKTDCESLATCNQTRYNEEKRGGDIYGKNSKCICTC